MPVVDLGLQRVADREQRAILRSQIFDDRGKPGPERIRRDPRLRGRFLRDEVEQNRGDHQSMGIDAFHDGLSCWKWSFLAAFGSKAAKCARREAVFGALLASKSGR